MEGNTFKTCKIRMSKKAMSDLMYAVVMTKSKITSTLGIGIYNYTRAQNAYNGVSLMLSIPPENIEKFKELSGVELDEPIRLKDINLN